LSSKNAPVVNALFTPDEQKLFQQFADVSARATNTAVNASNSAAALGGIIQRVAASFGGTPLARFLVTVPLAKGLTEAVNAGRTTMATKGVMPTPSTPLTVGSVGAGAAAGSSDPSQERATRAINSFLAR